MELAKRWRGRINISTRGNQSERKAELPRSVCRGSKHAHSPLPQRREGLRPLSWFHHSQHLQEEEVWGGGGGRGGETGHACRQSQKAQEGSGGGGSSRRWVQYGLAPRVYVGGVGLIVLLTSILLFCRSWNVGGRWGRAAQEEEKKEGQGRGTGCCCWRGGSSCKIRGSKSWVVLLFKIRH